MQVITLHYCSVHFIYSLSSKDDVLEFDTKISEDDMGGSGNATSEFDLGTAVELLGLDDEDAKTQASKLQGAYMSFLLLRHLRLRDLQRSVRIAFLLNLRRSRYVSSQEESWEKCA